MSASFGPRGRVATRSGHIGDRPARALRPPIPEILLCTAGVVERIAWLASQPTRTALGEAMNVAVALGQGRGFAGAYGAGHGATAHLLPLGPAFAGGVYRWLAPGSIAAEAILAAWSIGLAIGSYLLVFRAAGRLGIARTPRLIALALGMLAPAYISIETIDFRVWEGGLATFLAALFLDRILAAHGAVDVSRREIRRFPWTLVACACLVFFVNPPLGVSAFVCLLILGLAKMPLRANVAGAAMAAGFLSVAIVPWTVRNYYALGEIVPLRSNAGLELALANNREMAETTDPSTALEQRLFALHPTANPRARQDVIRNGEVAYSDRLGAQAKVWIADNPGSAVRLWSRHIRQMLLPDRWMTDPRHSMIGGIRALYIQAIGLAGLLGLARLLLRRRGAGAVYPAVMVLFTVILIAPFQPVSRYAYVLYPSLCFLAAAWWPLLDRDRRVDGVAFARLPL